MNPILKDNDIEASSTALFICDIQEKFQPAIDNFNGMLEVAQRLVKSN
jgi:hypothetical protein